MENEKKKIYNFFNFLKGLGIAFVITFIFLIVLATILTYTDISETITNPSIIIITALSILIGSCVVNIKIKKRGLINGGILGGIYIILLYLFSSIYSMDFSFTMQSVLMVIIGIVFGILGGIIGVNISAK